LTYKKRFDYICKSELLKYRLNYKVLRWVKHFIEKLKQKIGQTNKNKFSRIKKTVSASVLMRLHRGHPSSKVIKDTAYDKDVHYEKKHQF
jgi:hypothetical protein